MENREPKNAFDGNWNFLAVEKQRFFSKLTKCDPGKIEKTTIGGVCRQARGNNGTNMLLMAELKRTAISIHIPSNFRKHRNTCNERLQKHQIENAINCKIVFENYLGSMIAMSLDCITSVQTIKLRFSLEGWLVWYYFCNQKCWRIQWIIEVIFSIPIFEIARVNANLPLLWQAK